MTEQIERDRKALREQRCKQEKNKFSYVPYLLGTKQKQLKKSLKLHNLSTINILYYVEESFKLGDKYILNRLDVINEVLLQRSNLFDSVLLFLQNATVRNDLHYWIPGLTVDNVFSFITRLLPDFVSRYKEYYMCKAIVGEAFIDCFKFIKERYKEEHDQFRIMEMDLHLFENCLSLSFWNTETTEYADDMPGIEGRIDVSDDLEGVLIPELSFIDFSIGERKFVVSLAQFSGLINRRDETKAFWIESGVVDDEWRILV